MRHVLALLLCCLCSQFLIAQSISQNYWEDIDERDLIFEKSINLDDLEPFPLNYRTLKVDFKAIKDYLATAPMEYTPAAKNAPLLLDLPMPDGSLVTFEIFESPNMAPALQAKHMDIRSFSGRATDHSHSTVRLDYGTQGFHAFIHSLQGDIYIIPYAKGISNDHCISYFTKNEVVPDGQEFICGVDDATAMLDHPLSGFDLSNNVAKNGAADLVELKTYRFALTCTGEWAQSHGSSMANVLSNFNTITNALNSVIVREVKVRVVLIDETEDLVFLDPDNDPYLAPGNANNLVSINTSVLDGNVGISSFDIGHVFTNSCVGVGGIAALASACSPTSKGNGVSCNGGSNITNFVVNTTAHEIGHQLSSPHSFNNCPININGGNPVSPSNAYEPGSGSTIMSYQGACGNQNISNVATPQEYFNIGTLNFVDFFTTSGNGNNCGVTAPTTNHYPEVTLDYQNGFYIPIGTPFELECTATDEDGDNLSYCWEQYNLGPISELGTPFGDAPGFRSFPPNDDPMRVFPRLGLIIGNNSSDEEVLPTITRNMTFRVTVRDDNPEVGGVIWEEVDFDATASAGPFVVSYPSALDVEWKVGDFLEVTWDVANTTNSLVNCQFVNILLSTDNGNTFPITLAENAANDGSEFIVVPNNVSSNARIRIEAANNIFFDMSNNSFDIIPPEEPGYALGVSPLSQQVCLPDAATIEMQTASLLDFNEPVNFEIVSGLPTDAVANFSANPALPSDGSTISIDIPETTPAGNYDLEIIAYTDGGDTIMRNAQLIVVNNDFSAFELQGPDNGISGASQNEVFTWTALDNADFYEIEIATNPGFGDFTVVSSAQTSNSFESALEDNTIYYWRVRPVNTCGKGDFTETFALHTLTFVCSEYETEDIPVVIPSANNSVAESVMTIEADGAINDMNLLDLSISYAPVNALEITLTSPAGTTAILFDQNCGNTNEINLNFDDEAGENISCPPNMGSTYLPVEPLSIFDNESSMGDWTLKVVTNASGFDPGSIASWDLEMCANLVITEGPFIVNNIERPVPPNDERLITNTYLFADDNNNEPEDLEFTIVEAPQGGTLFFLDNQSLGVGGKFKQSTINAGNLKYVHDGGAAATDYFTFTVADGEGGWIGITQFDIVIDPNAPVGTLDLDAASQIMLFPNPAQDLLNVQFLEDFNGTVELSIVNAQGQLLYEQITNDTRSQLNTASLAGGVYFLRIKNKDGIVTKKFSIQR